MRDEAEAEVKIKRNKQGQFMKGTNGETYNGFGIWYDRKGYATIWLNGKSIKLHRYIWEKENGPISKGLQIHHIDNNKRNYNLKNLEIINQSDHFKLHAGWIRKKGKWILKPCKDCGQLLPLDNFYQRKGLTPSNICKKCSLIMWQEIGKNREYKKHRKIYMKQYYLTNKNQRRQYASGS